MHSKLLRMGSRQHAQSRQCLWNGLCKSRFAVKTLTAHGIAARGSTSNTRVFKFCSSRAAVAKSPPPTLCATHSEGTQKAGARELRSPGLLREGAEARRLSNSALAARRQSCPRACTARRRKAIKPSQSDAKKKSCQRLAANSGSR